MEPLLRQGGKKIAFHKDKNNNNKITARINRLKSLRYGEQYAVESLHLERSNTATNHTNKLGKLVP